MARCPFKMPVMQLVGTSILRVSSAALIQVRSFFGQVFSRMYRGHCHSVLLVIVDNLYARRLALRPPTQNRSSTGR
jgi:hypothetical protein